MAFLGERIEERLLTTVAWIHSNSERERISKNLLFSRLTRIIVSGNVAGSRMNRVGSGVCDLL